MESDERAFESRFGGPPDARIIVPGRVNLIGEHIDYCGLAVLPTAVQRHVTCLVRARADAVVRVTSAAPGHEPRTFAIESPLSPFPVGDWGNYAKAAVASLAAGVAEARGFDASLESTLPVSAGLSSSSAVVIAVALAFLHTNGIPYDPLDLAARMARAEQYVGTMGGGMDQAIILLARRDHACRIDFDPLRALAIPIPPGWTFVVAHSLVDAHKSGAAQADYNRRRSEAEAARASIATRLGVSDASWREMLASFAPDQLLGAARACEEPLRSRFVHIVTEAARVERAVVALDDADIEMFGTLMTRSHESLRDGYDVSHPALDRLVEVCMRGGARGARLTGAGFGGCVVALADHGNAENLIDTLRETFYAPQEIPPALLDERLFIVRPAPGAAIEAVTT